MILGGVFALNGVLLTVIFTVIGGPFWLDSRLDERGVQAQAMPTRVERTGSRVNNEQVYEIYYTYTAADGSQQTRSARSRNQTTLAAAQAKTPLTIEYDPQNPDVSRIHGERASVFGWFVLIPVVSALIGLAVLLNALPQLRRIRRIYITGTPTKAKVIAVKNSAAKINGRVVMRVDYEFQSAFGPIKGTSGSTSNPEVGSEIWIVYDPVEPGANVAL
jgi:hypothetical protein